VSRAFDKSEEELCVGTAERETGRARLRKYIVEEPPLNARFNRLPSRMVNTRELW
jgi:hypothetical protein